MPKGIRIISSKDGFRRAGLAHTKEPKEYPVDQFTKDQLEALKTEPMLTVTEVDLPDTGKEGKTANDTAKKGKK